MSEFLTGILTYNEPSAQYEGVIYDRRLIVRCDNGVDVFIFDPFEPISEKLMVGSRYEVIVNAQLPLDTIYTTASSPEVPDGWWRGIIRDMHWRIPRDTSYQLLRPDLRDRDCVLLETPLGFLLTSSDRLRSIVEVAGMSVEVGSSILWKFVRLDLEAVV